MSPSVQQKTSSADPNNSAKKRSSMNQNTSNSLLNNSTGSALEKKVTLGIQRYTPTAMTSTQQRPGSAPKRASTPT